MLFLFLNVFISSILIGLDIAAYFLLNDYVEGFWKGVLVAICAGVVNAIYLKLAVVFVKLENHKFLKDREGSLSMKIMVFRFINTNLSILYAILRAKREAD